MGKGDFRQVNIRNTYFGMNMYSVRNQAKAESYFDESTGLERRRRVGGGGGFLKPEKTVGSKREVWNGKADHTSGGLSIDKLGKNKRGHIVSVIKHLQGKQRIGQLARSPFFGRIQDLNNSIRAGGNNSKKQPKSPKSPKRAQHQSYLEDIARLGGVGMPQNVGFQPQNVGFQPQNGGFQPQNIGFQPQNLGFQAPMAHLPFPQPMPAMSNNYGYAQPPYPSMY